MEIFITAQIFGFLGMMINVLSYQGKKQKTIIVMQLFGSLFFAVNMFMLNAIMGGMLNVIGVFRAIIYSNKNRIKHIMPYSVLFICLYILSYFSVFVVFKKEINVFNVMVELLPLIAMTAMTVGFSKTEASTVRKLTLISSPSWLIYNCINLSVGGIICEIFSLISVCIGMFRYDIKQNKNKNGGRLC